MINWYTKNRNKRLSQRIKSNRSKHKFGDFEQLEEKRCLAFLGFFDGVTLEIEQTTDDGDVLVENTLDVWRATDNSGTFTFVNAENVSIEMLSNTVNRLDFEVATEHTGDVTMLLSDGAREVFFTGALNEIGGDLSISGGADTQSVNLGSLTSAPLIVGGGGEIHLGQEKDFLLNESQLLTFTDDVNISGVNEFQYSLMIGEIGPPVIISDLTIDTTVEDLEFIMIPTGGSAYITGDFNFFGGVNIDEVDLGASTIEQNVNIDLGAGVPFFGNPQHVVIAGTVMFGDVNIAAGDSNLGNLIELTGAFMGNIVSYTGGDLVDTVIYSFVGPQADVFATMGGGDDVFELNTPVNQLEIDFGNDPGDEFVNNVDPIDFEVDLLNYHFFDHVYTAVNDNLVMTQLADTGDIIIDNDGGLSGFDWQITTALTPAKSTIGAENLIVNLLSNTGNDLDMDLINPVIASITLNLNDGARNVMFVGISNNPLRDIVITAGLGDQQVDLAVNHPLGVATLDVNLGAGFDTVEDNGRPLIVDEDMLFTGVNHFAHDGLVSVFRNAFIDTTGETEDTLFAMDGSLFVGSQFTFTGGDGADEVRLNGPGGVEITKETLIDVGDSTTGGPQLVLLDSATGEFGRSVTVVSSNANTTDEFVSDPGTQYKGNLSVDLGGGTNDATLVGVFTASTVNYMGGSGPDVVVYGMTGTPADISITLGAGDDQVDLLAGSSISSPLFIDFGTGNDAFNNLYGAFDFDATLLGLQGFDHNYVLASNTLTSIQVEDLGNVRFDNGTVDGSIRVDAGGNASTLGLVDNLSISLLDGTTNLQVQLDNTLAGNLIVDMGNGARDLGLAGSNNTIGGNFVAVSGAGDQIIRYSQASQLFVGGNMSINMGSGDDVADEGISDLTVAGNLNLTGVNRFTNNAAMTVGGNVVFDVSAEAVNSNFVDASPMIIGGDFTYNGSSADDTITFKTVSEVGGNILINAGDGTNTATLVNILGGSAVSYTGGAGVDTVTYGTTGSAATLNINLGANDDVFTLNAGANIVSPLTIDFGTGDDAFINNYGVFDFDAVLNGLNGFNHNFNLAGSTLTSTQVEVLGGVTVDNNGAANSFQFTTGGGTSSLAPADNLTVTLLDGMDPLTVNLDNALGGNLAVNLANDARTTDIGGASGAIGGDLDVTGGDGAHIVNVDASVTGNIDVALGNGANVATLVGDSGGSVNYTGGDDADVFSYDMGGAASDVSVDLGAGDDTFNLMAGANVNSLFVDFGTGNDTFNNSIGALNFPTTLLGLGGFNHTYDPVSGTLTSEQVEANGGVVIFDDNGTGGAVRVTAGSTSEFGLVTDLNVTMLDDSMDALNFDFDSTLTGNLTVDLGDGSRFVNFVGSSNLIGGDLNLTGGTDDQTVSTTLSGLTVRGQTAVDLGAGNDSFIGSSGDFGGNVVMTGVNQLSLSNTTVAGDLTVDNSAETDNSRFFDQAILDLAGDFLYLGSSANDVVTMNASSSYGGEIDIQAGDGDNDATILGTFGGANIDYTGGSGSDNVTLGTTGNDADVNIRLNTGDDSFHLNAGTAITPNSLRVDFGGGDDSFTSDYGLFDFNARLLDLDGYNAIFDLASGNVDLTQIADTGDLTVDNNGLSDSIRFGTDTMNDITPANDLRVILMDNTSTNVTADFDSVRDGITTIQLRSGDRDVMMTGSSNTFTGLLRFEAADGVQNINLAVNAPLNADGTLVVNTRDGGDVVSADQAINVGNAMLLRGVNTFVNNAGVDVGGDFNVITLLEDEKTRLISNTTFAVGGNLTYLGGEGVDTINFKDSGATIDGFLYADLATASDATAKQRVSLTGGFSASSVVVDGGSSTAGTFFSTDDLTSVSGDMIVNLAASSTSNTAIFMGNYSGTYATYRGGSASDFIEIGVNGGLLEFAVLSGGGNDVLTVSNTTDVDFLYGDMGSGNDALDNQFPGDFPFDNNIFNL